MLSYQVVHKEKIDHYEEELERLRNTIRQAAEFIHEIETGNLEAEYSGGEDDVLRKALLAMRDQLKKISDQEEEQTWVNNGLARFADIIRANYKDLYEFSHTMISSLVKHLKVNQGGIFILQGEDSPKPWLEMYGSYAYNRKKYLEKKIFPGQGLLGQCYLEKETIYMTEAPDQYVTVTSGLGEATPGAILIVPLKFNDYVVGVIEIASFEVLKPYQISFVEKIAESMANAVSSQKINDRTQRLLAETQEQTESLRAQEEEMRQNLEELQATQERQSDLELELRSSKQTLEQKLAEHERETERMIRYMEDYKKVLIDVLDELPLKIFLKDEEGKFILVNTAVANAHNSTIEKLIGTSDFDHFKKEDATEWRNQELEIINGGIPVIFYHDESISGKMRSLKTMKRPIYIHHLDQTGLLGVQMDITEMKKLEEQLKDRDKIIAEFRKTASH